MDINSYVLSHSDPEPELLARINRHTHLKVLNPRMLSGHLQGRVLSMISKMIQPTYVLEIGTFTGYSAICLAEGLTPKGELHTIEIDDELADMIVGNFDASPNGQQIFLHTGDALSILKDLIRTWDLVFIDADKREYDAYFEAILPQVRPGGFILADNTLWDGKVLMTPLPQDDQTKAIMDFNDKIANDQRIEKVILPFRDGLTLIRKK